MIIDDLNQIWAAIDLPAAAGMLAGREVPDQPTTGVTLALDRTGLRHLLVPVSDGEEPPNKSQTKGLDVSIDELKVGDRPTGRYLDVACRDASMHGNFSVVALEIIAALADGPDGPSETVERILKRWRWFWGAPPNGLSEESTIGLFGELWFLEFWLAPVTSVVIDTWRGPFGDRHDFKWPTASIEVKATRVRSDGSASHRISALDQLEDPESGVLHLFSLRVTPDPIGAHSLEGSVNRIRDAIRSDANLLHAFEERLARAGYSPAQRDRYTAPIRVVAEELFVVRDGFPRITRNSFAGGIPGGVGDITYTLDLAACDRWRIADRPAAEPARELRASLAG